jgi:type II secretion system protein G
MVDNKNDNCNIPIMTKRKCAHYSLGNRGFTMVELIVVMGIIGVLATMALSAYFKFKDNARNTVCASQIREIERSINAYALDNGGSFPTSDDSHDLSGLGLDVPKDPWGNDFYYTNIVDNPGSARLDAMDEPLNGDFDLYSNGVDGLSAPANSDDDLIRAGDGGFVGLAN